MTDVLEVTERTALGKRNNARLRRGGAIPAVLYGHGAENVNLAIPTEQFEGAMRHGSKVVELSGAAKDSALISHIQWDTFGAHPLHVDLIRVSKDERVEVTIALETRGVAPGASAGGMVQLLVHEIVLECPASGIPEKLEVNINELNIGESISASAIELPSGARLMTDAETTVLQCVEVAAEEESEEGEGAAATAEPEVIGRAAEDEEKQSNSD